MTNETNARSLPIIAIVGGAGKLGSALARRLALAAYPVHIGSREAGKARDAAEQLSRASGHLVTGDTNAASAAAGEIVILAVPYDARAGILREIKDCVSGKVLVDTTVPLRPPKVMRVQLPQAGCAAVETQMFLGESVKVVAAFHNVAAHRLATDADVDCDVLVFADDKNARSAVVELASACRLRGLHAGALANSAAAEALTSVLIFINRTYSADGAGIRITGELKAITNPL